MRTRSLCMVLALAAALLSRPALPAQTEETPKATVSSKNYSTRDLSGVWMERDNEVTFGPKEPPLQPWAEDVYKAAKPSYGPRGSPDSKDPILTCLPPGVPRILLIPFPMQIVQTPDDVFMIFEYDHYVRQIYTNRTHHPRDLDPSWMGDSIGRWDGDTFVVDTVGLNDKSWLDQVGHPHSSALHVTERIRRVDHDTLEDDISFDDPKAFTKPWEGRQVFKLRPTWHLMEYVCEDNMSGPDK